MAPCAHRSCLYSSARGTMTVTMGSQADLPACLQLLPDTGPLTSHVTFRLVSSCSVMIPPPALQCQVLRRLKNTLKNLAANSTAHLDPSKLRCAPAASDTNVPPSTSFAVITYQHVFLLCPIKNPSRAAAVSFILCALAHSKVSDT